MLKVALLPTKEGENQGVPGKEVRLRVAAEQHACLIDPTKFE